MMKRISCSLSLGFVFPFALSAAQGPVTVSPGSVTAETAVESRCPSFSWGVADGARAYELAVYGIDSAGDVSPVPVIEEKVSGAALSWTPPLARCLVAGSRYAWSIRSIGGENASDWSPPSLFTVSSGPGEGEFREAVEVVRRYLALGAGAASGSGSIPGASSPGQPSPTRPGDQTTGPPARVPTNDPAEVGFMSELADTGSISFGAYGRSAADESGSAGLVGETTAAAGETYGVIGRHTGGAGSLGAAGAFTSSGGADVLKGFAQGFEVFKFDTNGSLTIPAGGFACSSCIHGSDIASSTITGNEIANSTITGSDIANGSITGSDILSSSIFSSDIAPNTIGETDLAAGSVGADELDPIDVVSVECNGECSDSTLAQVCAVAGSNRRAIAVDCDSVDSDTAGQVPCGGDNQCFANNVFQSAPLSNFCNDGTGFDAQVYCLQNDD